MDTNLEVGDDGAEIGSQSLSFFGYPESVAEEPAKIRNLVSDDQPLLLYGISAYLNSQPDMMVYPNRKSSSPAATRTARSRCRFSFFFSKLRSKKSEEDSE
jgi:hypothetical protein